MPGFRRHRNARLLAGVFVSALMLLSGCTTPPQTRALLTNAPALPRQVELREIPYFAQEIHQCGPATLAMALNAAGAATTPEQLAPQVYLPGREGSLQIEMLAATRRHGLLAYPLAPLLTDVLTEIAAGRPVVVLQNLAFNWYPRWHYAVAIGYDLDARTITLRSGPEARQQLPLRTFEYTWARSGHWALLALPPAQLPATAAPEPYLNAALALEKTGPAQAARAAYQTATTRWPEQFGGWIGLGNTAYAARDFKAATQAFRAAIALRPEEPVAHNNLADTLLQQGDLEAARTAAQTAVRLGGAHAEAYAQTLAEIETRLANSSRRTPPPAPPALPAAPRQNRATP